MTEKEKLEQLVRDGFIPHLALRTPNVEELEKCRIPAHHAQKVLKALPMHNPESGEKIMFYITEEDTLDLAKELTRIEKEPISFHFTLFCRAYSFPPQER